jgi:hypothetical protein
VEIFAIPIGIVIAAGVFWYISRPLLQPRRKLGLSSGSDVASLEVQRNLLYAQISELDLDHETGKTNDEDHQHMRAELVAQAADVLRQLDTAQTAPRRKAATGPEDAIEAAIAARRKQPARASADDIEAAIAVRRKTRSTAAQSDLDQQLEAAVAARRSKLVCPTCGKPVSADDVFCSKCGTALQPQATR